MSTIAQHIESISLPHVLGIRNISDLHLSIAEFFQDRNSIVLEFSDLAEADLSFVQLVESARRHAEVHSKAIALASPAKGNVLKILERAGFVEAFNRDDAKFWLHKEVTL